MQHPTARLTSSMRYWIPASLFVLGLMGLAPTAACAQQNVVRKMSPGADLVISGASDEIISTFARNGARDACSWTDGVPAIQTSIDCPMGACCTVSSAPGKMEQRLSFSSGRTSSPKLAVLTLRVDLAHPLLTYPIAPFIIWTPISQSPP